jgi:hypothetical protein
MARDRTFIIEQRSDGRYVSRNDIPTDSPLGVDPNLDMAIGSARREATLTSKAEGCTVIIKYREGTKLKEVDRVEPPNRR